MLAVGRDSKVAYNLNLTFLNILNFVFVSLLYDDMVRSPRRKFWSFCHCVPCLPHLLSSPLTEMSFTNFPYILIFTYTFIFLPAITEVKVTSNNTYVHLFIEICDCIYLIYSLLREIKTL